MPETTNFTLSVAPMMDWTDRHCRMFHRMLSSRALLYTEMVVANAVIHGDREHLLGFDNREQPTALQVGGSDPLKLSEATKIGADFGYAEINLNVGCPSDRVQNGRFGACLMAEPDLVAKCFEAMRDATNKPVTIKCRIGIDNQDAEQTLPNFLRTIESAGCQHVIIHARKAWLDGLSPKENRNVPPLDYNLVRAMKTEFPHLKIILNGGLETIEQAITEAAGLDGVMFGRAAYHMPWRLTRVDDVIYQNLPFEKSRNDIARQLIAYAASVENELRSTKALTRHIMGLYHGEPGARVWRRTLSEAPSDMKPSNKIALALSAINQVQSEAA